MGEVTPDVLEEVTPDVLKKVAKLLGHPDLRHDTDHDTWFDGNRFAGICVYVSSGDLLLAILNKAAEMGYDSRSTRPHDGCVIRAFEGSGVSEFLGAGDELTAALLAFSQLEVPNG